MNIQERILAHLKYKIEEHSRAAADHQLQADTYRKFKDYAEAEFESTGKIPPPTPKVD